MYSILSSIYGIAFKKARKMDANESLANSNGGTGSGYVEAAQAGADIFTSGLGILNVIKHWNDDPVKEQYENEVKLMQLQDEMNKRNANEAMQRQKEMYEYTGYASKVRQLKEAGLNPALVYGMGGSGGGTIGSPIMPQVTKGNAPNSVQQQSNIIAQQGMGLQLAKLQSEIQVNRSVAEANMAAAERTREADIPKIKQETANLAESINLIQQQTKSEIVKREGQDLLNTWQKVDNLVKTSTSTTEIERAAHLTKEIKYSADKIAAEAQVSESTIGTMIQQQELKCQEIVSTIIMNNAKTQLTKDESYNIYQKIKQEYYNLSIAAKGNEIDLMGVQASISNTLLNNKALMDRQYVQSITEILKNLLGSRSSSTVQMR